MPPLLSGHPQVATSWVEPLKSSQMSKRGGAAYLQRPRNPMNKGPSTRRVVATRLAIFILHIGARTSVS